MIQANGVKKTTAAASRVSAKVKVEAPVVKSSKSNGDLAQKIAQKAYELYVARGCANGHDVEDWAKAEKIVRGS